MHHAAPYATHHVPPEAVRVGEALRVCALLLLDEVSQALNLTVWDFRDNYRRFGVGGRSDSTVSHLR